MSDRQAPREPDAGLCKSCRFSRRIVSSKGSVFRLCELSERDPRYKKYPPLPVRQCTGYEACAGHPPQGGAR